MKNKRIKKVILIFIIILLDFIYSSFFYKVNAEETTTEELLKSQSDSIGISSFIEEANKYRSEDFDVDVNELITSAIKGKINNESIGKEILSILFKEAKESITSIRKYNDCDYCFKRA